jgi:hypothetical protein
MSNKLHEKHRGELLHVILVRAMEISQFNCSSIVKADIEGLVPMFVFAVDNDDGTMLAFQEASRILELF